MALHPLFDDSYCLIHPRSDPRRHPLILNAEDIVKPIALLANLLGYQDNENRLQQSSGQVAASAEETDKNSFRVNLDVQQFKPEEITVKVTGENAIIIEAKHEEKQDEHGFISRHFVRKYVLPKEYDISKLKSKLSSDGVLSIVAPSIKSNQIQYTEIPVIKTGEPLQVKEKKDETQKDKQ